MRKNIYAGDKLVATIEGTSTAAKVYTNHLDHLGGTRAVTEYDGDTAELLDYYPFGGIRISDQYLFDQKKKFTGHEWDEQIGVYYMGARYYEPEVKRFLSQDPAFLLLGDHRFEQKFNRNLQQYLTNPQQLNAYSYAINNPLTHVDREGKAVETVADIGFVALDLYFLGKAVTDRDWKGAAWAGVDLALDSLALATPFVPSVAGISSRGGRVAGNVVSGGRGGGSCIGCKLSTSEISKKYNWGKSSTLNYHFNKHGSDFGARSAADYASMAQAFYNKKYQPGVSSFEDSSGVTRIYQKSTNTFGTYNVDGSTKSFYKPDPSVHGYETNLDYWNALKKQHD